MKILLLCFGLVIASALCGLVFVYSGMANGVRRTGMPAFGPTHSDGELWDLVVLVKQLPRMSGAEYRALAPRIAGEHHEHEHTHEHRH